MAGKKVWVTWMPTGEGAEKPDKVLSSLQGQGLQIDGSTWIDDLEKMAWYEMGTSLLEKKNADLWLVAGRKADLEAPRNRYALSLLTAMVRDGRGPEFPVFHLGLDYRPEADAMPMLTRDFRLLAAADRNWPAQIATAFIKKARPEAWDFRLSASGHPFIGQWFEVGPQTGEWEGVMFGVSGEGKIVHHLVGPKGQLPEKSVVEYPMEGIKAEVRQVEYGAWSVQNKISTEDSYYVKVEGFPKTILFGGHPGTDKAEVTVAELI
jgi:hypothetical protein